MTFSSMRFLRSLSLALPLLLTSLGGCGSTTAGVDSGTPTGTGLQGTWQTLVADVTITVTLSGSETSGTVQTSQATRVTGDTPGCTTELVGTGTYTVTGTSIDLDTPTAVQRVRGCSFPDSEDPTDATPLQNFADALSGPYVLTATTLQLGSSYPMLTRLTR